MLPASAAYGLPVYDHTQYFSVPFLEVIDRTVYEVAASESGSYFMASIFFSCYGGGAITIGTLQRKWPF